MIRSHSEALDYLREGWTLIENCEGWHIEREAREIRVSTNVVEFLCANEFVQLVAKRKVFQLNKSKTY